MESLDEEDLKGVDPDGSHVVSPSEKSPHPDSPPSVPPGESHPITITDSGNPQLLDPSKVQLQLKILPIREDVLKTEDMRIYNIDI